MIVSRNPYNGEEVASVKEFNKKEIDEALEAADKRFQSWRQTSFSERSKLMMSAAAELKKNKQEYAETITLEMGKPITQLLPKLRNVRGFVSTMLKMQKSIWQRKLLKQMQRRAILPLSLLVLFWP